LGYALPHGRATDRAFPQNDFSRITNFLIADLGHPGLLAFWPTRGTIRRR